MKKVMVIVPFPMGEEDLARRQAQMKAVDLGPGIEFHYRSVRVGPKNYSSQHDMALADFSILDAGLDAEKEGFNAVCIDAMSDSGMVMLRSVLSIPVIGAGKASMLFALTLGGKFSVLAQWAPALPRYRKAIREYGFERQCASVRSFDQPPDFSSLLGGKEDSVFPRMRDVAMRCIEEDGAEVICLGSTTMHQAGEYLAANLPVPVINPGPLTYKLVETFLVLSLTHGRDVYPPPVEPRLDMLHAMMKAGALAEGALKGS